ncbi:hypothetical protein PC110_g19255 [Phytophthora cactorum]|nr:hypothetical protein PC120_g14895 [Phytophthora cactorum]KAG3194996.1 hypothetical protein PC128_g8857 [Phytophthora cactorum]RAW24310.1 hypothetical protein PC110_g19255 [Phytophthora cactorum]
MFATSMLGRAAARSARSLVLRRQQRLADHKPITKAATRCFSISSDGESEPQLENGKDLLVGVWRRSIRHLTKLSEYQDKGIFIDSLSILNQCWLFVMLHFPKKTSVDLLEFMEGAQTATEANLRAMNSVEFPEFLAGKKSGSSKVVEDLKQYTTPAYYNQMALQVKKNYLHRNFYIECEALGIEQAQLAQVVYRRLTEKEYEDLVAFRKKPTGTSPKATVEHLRLHVDVATVEDLNVVYLRDKARYVQQQNVYRVVFESRVTDPEEVDWRIESMHIIEQKAMPRPEETSVGAADEKEDK